MLPMLPRQQFHFFDRSRISTSEFGSAPKEPLGAGPTNVVEPGPALYLL